MESQARLSSHVKAVHRGLGTVLEHGFDRIGGKWYGLLDRLVHATENVVGDGHADRRAPDTDTYPNEIAPEPLNDGPQAVMTARPAANLYPHYAPRKVQIVMHHDKLDSLIPYERRPRIVHVRRRLEQCDVLEAEAQRGSLSLLLRPPGAAVALRKLISNEEADVVPGTLVGAAWVTKSHNDGRLYNILGRFLFGLAGDAAAKEAREPKVGDSVQRGLPPSPRRESSRSPLQLRPPRPR